MERFIRRKIKEMTFPISPGVYTTETDLTQQVPALGDTTGAIAGPFLWGPIFEPYLVTSQQNYQQIFWTPSNFNPEVWFCGYNFLYFGTSLYVTRCAQTITANVSNVQVNFANMVTTAVAYPYSLGQTFANRIGVISNTVLVDVLTINENDFINKVANGTYKTSNVSYIAKYPGSLGSSLRVGQVNSPQQYNDTIYLNGSIANGASQGNGYTGIFSIDPGVSNATITFTITSGSNVAAGNTYANIVMSSFGEFDYIRVSTLNRTSPYQMMQIGSISNTITNSTVSQVTLNMVQNFAGISTYTSNAVIRWWEYYNLVAPPNSWTTPYQANTANPTAQDVICVCVVDELGNITGSPNTVLEIYNNLSFATDAQGIDGNTIYYQNIINQNSQWIRVGADPPGVVSNTSLNVVNASALSAPYDASFVGGQDGDPEGVMSIGPYVEGYSYYQSKEAVTIDLVIAGKALGGVPQSNIGIDGGTYNNYFMAQWLISNIAEYRKDCVVFFSPDKQLVVNNQGFENQSILDWASLIDSTTYAVCDTGYRYQYDAWSNLYRWIPYNGDIAGLCVYTDLVSYPWFSPAGFNRGQIPNVVKVAFNPNENERDQLYPAGIDPIVTFPGLGTYLYGDKTFTSEATAFSRINVRRLFLYMERAISAIARYTLFELNDTFSQNNFKNLINPFLAGIQAARGVYDYAIVCDATNNTPEVDNNNQFLCAIYVMPEMSINFIRLDFVAVPQGVSFNAVELPSL
jgi:hypothetical protein